MRRWLTHLLRALRIVAGDERIPRPLRWLLALALLPIPGPLDELLLVCLLPWALVHRRKFGEAWRAAR